MSELTEEQKSTLYDLGAYSFPAPPVYSGNWDRVAWITYITGSGHWDKSKLPKGAK